MERASDRWQRFKRVLAGERLPAALVDLEAFERNVDRLFSTARGKRIRVATKSIRCPSLVKRIAERAGDRWSGLMTYAAAEMAWLAKQGYRDLLLAYPTVQPEDTALLAEANVGGAKAAVVIDSAEHLPPLAAAAARAGTTIPVVIDVDLSYRPLGGTIHLGVRRSPLRGVEEVVELAARAASTAHLAFHGVMGYEAQIAGVTDAGPFAAWQNPAKRAIKRLSRPRVAELRAAIARALAARGLAPALFNGGGTGSLSWSIEEEALTEVTVGSGFLDSQLFDYYRDLALDPAAWFALQVVRKPGPGLVTCHGGGYVASGQPGEDRLPRPALPEGLSLLPLEGAGEVQTPLQVDGEVEPALGDPVLFRHAKAGELAEHFNEYLLVRGEEVEERAPTYRGLGHCFLG
jgi:D-serine deaminase-like pyridoxal phosphate-dependent protein